MDRWYVIATEPQKERFARDNLAEAGFEAFLPLERRLGRDRERKPCVVDRPLFAGYLLVRLDLGDDGWGAVKRTRGVRHTLPVSRERPLPVSALWVEGMLAKDIARSQVTLDDLLGRNRRGKRKPAMEEGASVKADLSVGVEYDALVRLDMGERIRVLIGALEFDLPAEKVRAA